MANLPLPLPPVVDLPMPATLRARLQALWALLDEAPPERPAAAFKRRAGGGGAKKPASTKGGTRDGYHHLLRSSDWAWQDECEALAKKVNTGDAGALIELVRRDPRYLASQHLQAKVLECKLSIAAASRRVPAHVSVIGDKQSSLKGAGPRAVRRAGEARKWLAKLAQAIEYVSGRGNGLWTDLARLKEEYEGTLRRLQRAAHMIRAASASDIAAEVEIAQEWIEKLAQNPRRVVGLAEDIIMEDYSFSRENLRKLIRLAKDAAR